MTETRFTITCYYNENLAAGAREVDAVAEVTASGNPTSGSEAASTGASVVVIIDTSGSMDGKGKIQEARAAGRQAIACLRDGTAFAVIAGTEHATVVYPGAGGALAIASERTREEAQGAVGRLTAVGGTAIGTWLDAATDLLEGVQGVKQVILLTDGRNEGQSHDELVRSIVRATGKFECDCRGVGTDWSVDELRQISQALLGTVRLVADPKDLAADFTAMIGAAMGKAVADVHLRVWTPQGAKVRHVRQVFPEVADLTTRRVDVNALTGDYPTGSWGDETREYQVYVDLADAGAVGDDAGALAARISLMVNGEVAGKGLVVTRWTDDPVLSTRINPKVAAYNGQAELAGTIAEGLQARSSGDLDTATLKLGRAVQLARETGNEDTARLLAKVVDVEDAATGKVRLKDKVGAVEMMSLDTESTRTARVRQA